MEDVARLHADIGYIQYFTHLPAGLVWVHVTGFVLVWIAVLRLFLAVRSKRGKRCAGGPEAAVPSRHPGQIGRYRHT